MPSGTHTANLPDALVPLVTDGRVPLRRVWVMLALRSVLTITLLLSLAAAFAWTGRSDAVAAAARRGLPALPPDACDAGPRGAADLLGVRRAAAQGVGTRSLGRDRHRRPTALPYLMGLHFVLDASLPLLVLLVSRGVSLTGVYAKAAPRPT